MKKGRHAARDVSVGALVALAAVIFSVGIFMIGSEQRLWSRRVEYYLRLSNTNGLQVGAPVRLVGVQVGAVTDIVFPTDPNRVDLDVVLKVANTVAHRIREDSTASLKTLSVLAGDKFVEITPGSPSRPELPPGSHIAVPAAMGFEELQEIGAGIADDVQEITAALRVVLDQMQNRETLIGQALSDPNFGDETLAHLKESVLTTNRILKQVESGKGLAGRLLGDDEFAEAVTGRLARSLGRLESLVTRLADDQGALAKASDPNGPLVRSLANVEESTGLLLESMREIRKGRGAAGRLIADEAWSEKVLGDIEASTAALRRILDKIDGGQGTAGAFVNDPGIYQDLQDVLRGIKKSKLATGAVRHYREKGEKQRIEDETKPPADPVEEER